MDEKICLVTGANSGIGKAAALSLANLGARVILVSRDWQKGKAAQSEIKKRSKNELVDLLTADLSSIESTKKLADDVIANYSRLNVLVNNAGVFLSKRSLTINGIETTFATNHLGYFLLTNSLLKLMKKSAPARIINVASSAHQSASINFSDLNFERGYSGYRAYAQSKLANILFTYELARRIAGSGVTANCLHPGLVATNLGKDKPNLFRWLINLFKPLTKKPARAANDLVYLALSRDMEGVNGKYFINKKQRQSSPLSYDEQLAKKLWQTSEHLTE